MAKVTIFTDGASRGNPGPGGWGAIVVFPSGKTTIAKHEARSTKFEVRELGGREAKTTNNRMELTAVIEALRANSKLETRNSKFVIFTDSSYVKNGATKWVHDWVKRKWKTKAKKKVENQDLWKKFIKVSRDLVVEWKLLPSHAGIPANDRCDQIATTFADGRKPKLYSGAISNYKVNVSIIRSPKAQSLKLKARSSKKAAYSYVSLVNGVIKTQGTWTECEKRVKGISGAKFKKSVSLEDEQMIIKEWSR